MTFPAPLMASASVPAPGFLLQLPLVIDCDLQAKETLSSPQLVLVGVLAQQQDVK